MKNIQHKKYKTLISFLTVFVYNYLKLEILERIDYKSVHQDKQFLISILQFIVLNMKSNQGSGQNHMSNPSTQNQTGANNHSRSGSGGGQFQNNMNNSQNNNIQTLNSQSIPGANQSQSNSFQNIQKINNRLRARNPVLMSVQNNNGGNSNSVNAGAQNVLMPLSQRSLSPNSYQQLQQAVHHQNNSAGGSLGPNNARKPGSLTRKMHGSGNNHYNSNDQAANQSMTINNHHKSLNSPTTAPSLNEKYGVGASGYHHERQGASGGSHGQRAPQLSLNSHHGGMAQMQSPNNYNANQNRGANHHGGYHNFHPVQESQSSGNNTGHSIIHGSNHFHQFNLRDSNANHSRHNMVGNSLDNVNLMQSNDSSIQNAANNGQHQQQNTQQNPLSAGNNGQVQQVVQLNKKIIGHGNRKRNAREKSYDSYNQKLQLPPMIKTPQDRSDRTYSVPSAGHIGGMNGTNYQAGNNSMIQGQQHGYMLPLSPGGVTNQIHSQQQPKTSTHAQLQQRQSINEGLMNANGNQQHGIGMISGQGNNQGGSVSVGQSMNNNSQGNQIFTRFSNIQLQNSLANKGSGKISGQGGRAFQSVNNFFNPRTAGAQKHPQRERISTHHFQNDVNSPQHGNMHHHPMSPGGSINGGQSIQNNSGSNSRVGGGEQNNQNGQNGSIFLKNTFSPRMKIGNPPGSSGLGGQTGGMNSQNQTNYQMGSIGGPVKAAHHNRPGMGSHARNGSNVQGGQEEHRGSPMPNHSFNAQGTSIQSNSSPNQGQDLDRQSPARGKGGVIQNPHRQGNNSGSPNASFNSSSAPQGAAQRGSRSRPRPPRQNMNASLGMTGSNANSRSVETPQTDNLSVSTSAETQNSKRAEEGQRFQIPTPLSSEENKDSNIQFVEVQTLLFGENPAPLNPRTIQLKNHEPTKASQKKCGIIKSYAANTNQGIIRDYNEDRVSIILNILKPKNKTNLDIDWPQICFFGVFDGHGGSACADYLRDNLHNFVVQNEQFPQNPVEAIKEGFRECERNFLTLVEQAQARAQHLMTGQNVGPERSGSCASVVMIIDEMIYIINVGDSRAIMSIDAGAQIGVLSRDHKPDDELEKIRIQAAGGKIYRTQTFAKAAANPGEKDLYVQGPLRVFPGRLSVSKTFGDIEAKRPRYGGNPNVIVCDPDIKSFKIQDNFDFIMIGCDGIFERLNNRDCVDMVWDRITEQINLSNKMGVGEGSHKGGKRDESKKRQMANGNSSSNRNKSKGGVSQYNEHQAAADGVEIIIRGAAASRSLDNITSLILGLKGLKKTIQKLNTGSDLNAIRSQITSERQGIKNTYEQDFAFLEIMEPESGMINDAINLANNVTAAQKATSADKKASSISPTNALNKSLTSPKQNTSIQSTGSANSNTK